MKLQIASIAILTSLLLWSGSFFFLKNSYHSFQKHGLMPNFHIGESLGLH